MRAQASQERRDSAAAMIPAAARWAGWDGDCERVAQLLRSGRITSLSFSGRMGAGKDAVAESFAARRSGAYSDRDWPVFSISDPLKDELDDILRAARQMPGSLGSAGLCSEAAADVLGVRSPAVDALGACVADILSHGPGTGARSRLPSVRNATQILGTEIRRAQDPEWWTRRMVGRMLSHMEHGSCPIVTGTRYRNDVEGALRTGGIAFLVTADDTVRLRRLQERDGADAAAGADHSSEKEVGTAAGMTPVDNSRSLRESVLAVVSCVRDSGLLCG